jgi:acyl carrier protein
MVLDIDFESEVKNALVEEFQCSEEMIASKSRLRQDLGLDEYEIIDLAETIEERLRVAIDVRTFCPLQTVADIVAYLENGGGV